ncbi:MAG: TetR/AcrR family transcriptional regulator [Deltaproteobacteria bacterium]|nr:TetR/AcrR family transcriptional regulator [Deltaproteobacteria bacterium]
MTGRRAKKRKKNERGFEWPDLASQVVAMEGAGLVTRTFRRLDSDRQNAVLAAILTEAAERGPARVSIKEVAARAGVSVGSLYQYFGDRDHMVDFAVELSRGYLVSVLEASKEPLASLPLREGLKAYVEAGCDWAAEQAEVMRLFARAAYHGDASLTERLVEPVARAMRDVVRSMLAAAAARGEIDPKLDLNALAAVVHAMTAVLGDARMLPHLAAYLQLGTDPVDAGGILREALGLMLRGVTPRPGQSPG